MNNTAIKTKQQEIMQQQRKEKLREECGLVCKIDKDVGIYVDQFQYILVMGTSDNSRTYHTTIESVVDEMLSSKNKRVMLTFKNKNVESIIRAHEDLKKWFDEIVMPKLKKCAFKEF